MVLARIAIAAGAGDAGMGIMAAGQQAAMGEFLAFTRAQESSADLAGANIFPRPGSAARACLKFFSKLQNQEYRLAIYATDSYDRTHPLSSGAHPGARAEFHQDPAWAHAVDPKLEARFQRVKAKLLGFSNPKQAVVKYPETRPEHSGPLCAAYAYHLGGFPDKAQAEADALLAAEPDDPFFLELKGQILLEGGKPGKHRAAARGDPRSGNMPLIAAMLGHALVATEDAKNFTEAKQVLKTR